MPVSNLYIYSQSQASDVHHTTPQSKLCILLSIMKSLLILCIAASAALASAVSSRVARPPPRTFGGYVPGRYVVPGRYDQTRDVESIIAYPDHANAKRIAAADVEAEPEAHRRRGLNHGSTERGRYKRVADADADAGPEDRRRHGWTTERDHYKRDADAHDGARRRHGWTTERGHFKRDRDADADADAGPRRRYGWTTERVHY
ncbi:unnamed protein product [Periconia digitata]|uniref:Uncharacterized protein n=1 Tax=Periconia digitata TaxID=1303443 RepID=A0A9W4XX65_9PLEO|nr:unnamed protein product [Periconia digitata]